MSIEQSKEAGKLAAEQLADFVNRHGKVAFRAFAEQLCHNEHRTLQQSAFNVMLGCIEQWAKDCDTGIYDPRNAATCGLAKKITTVIGTEQFLPVI